MRKWIFVLLFCLVPIFSGCVGSQIKTAKKVVKKTGKIVDNAVRDILKAEVRIACGKLSVPGGYSDNEAVLIVLPEDLKDVRKKLASIGLDGEFKKIEKNLNRAAELAAAEALTVFIPIIKEMKIKDAADIISGGKNAATKFLRKKGEAKLRKAFSPLILKSLDQIQAAKEFNKLIKKYNAIPFVKPYSFSIEEYVADRAIEGLFVEMAVAEKAVRNDPDLAGKSLKNVFKMFK